MRPASVLEGVVLRVFDEVSFDPAEKEAVLLGRHVIDPVVPGVIEHVVRHAGSQEVVDRLPRGIRGVVVRQRHALAVELVRRMRNPARGNDIAGERVANEEPWPRRIGMRRQRIVDLVANRIDRQQPREVAVPHRHRGNGVIDLAGASRLEIAEFRIAEKEEELVPAIEQLGNANRAADGCMEVVHVARRHQRALGQLIRRGSVPGRPVLGDLPVPALLDEKRCGVPALVHVLISAGSVEVVGSRLGGHGNVQAGGMSERGIEVGCLDLELVDDVGAGHDRHAPVRSVGGCAVD